MCGQSLGNLHTIMRTMLAVVFGVKSEADFEKRISSESTSYPYSYKRKKKTQIPLAKSTLKYLCPLY